MVERCDRCGAQAYVLTVIDNGLPLAWCSHHYREHAAALDYYAAVIDDQRELLTKA